jgi:acetyl-CoA synthetase
LIEHPAVTEAAVGGSDELAAELQAHTRQLTAPYKYPRKIHFVTELPKTVSGKIRRSELRQQLRGQVGG